MTSSPVVVAASQRRGGEQPRQLMTCSRVAAIVLAAGRSSRMGPLGHKLLLPWGEKRILQVVVENLHRGGCSEVLVVLGQRQEELSELLASYAVRTVYNSGYADGLSTTVRAGVAAVNKISCPGYLFLPGDMPGVSPETIRQLCESFAAASSLGIVVPTYRGRRGNPVLFSATYTPELMALTGDTGARALVKKHAEHVVQIEVEDAGILQDLDTPAQYRAAVDRAHSNRMPPDV